MYLPPKARKRQSITKWENGKPTVMYARQGFGWRLSNRGIPMYGPVVPNATGITLQFHGPNHAERRRAARGEKGRSKPGRTQR